MGIEKGVIERIQKALALAKDKDDHESQTAMLLAQRLMVKHGISMAQVEEQKDEQPDKEVKRETVLPVEKWVWWKQTLANIIADNFRCHLYNLTSSRGRGQRAIIFLGLKEDTEIAKDVFQFALEQMEYHTKAYVKQRKIEAEQRKKEWLSSESYLDLEVVKVRDLERILDKITEGTNYVDDYAVLHDKRHHYRKISEEEYKKRLIQLFDRMCGYKVDTALAKNEYMKGFLVGLRDRFSEQVNKENWGLILVKDALVEQAYQDIDFVKSKHRSSTAKRYGDQHARQAGYKQGKAFSGGISKRVER